MLVLTGSGVQADENAAPAVPRYRLAVGQELSYRQASEFKYGKGDTAGTLRRKTEWQVWVARHNGDGSWRLVIRSIEKLSWEHGKGQKSDLGTVALRLFGPALPDPGKTTMAYCDLFADGRATANASLGLRMNPQVLFPRLPEDATAAGKGWESFQERDSVRSLFTHEPKAGPDGTWVFDQVNESAMDAIFLSSSRCRFTFDQKRGLVR